MEKSYSIYAKYYDLSHGEPKDKVSLINSWIKKYSPEASSILEIACGTGAILKLLEKKYYLSGLDLSKEMLNIAKNKVKGAKFYNEDMTSFSLNQKFDVILCIYDSINHLLKFEDWRKVFRNSAKHLNKDGLFIFDVNTLAKVNKITYPRTNIEKYGQDLVVNGMSRIGNNKIEFTTKVFENQSKNNFKFFEEVILEATFEKEKIIKALDEYFKVLLMYDPKRKKPSIKSERLYFVCKLK